MKAEEGSWKKKKEKTFETENIQNKYHPKQNIHDLISYEFRAKAFVRLGSKLIVAES